jgi:hypothetical protein
MARDLLNRYVIVIRSYFHFVFTYYMHSDITYKYFLMIDLCSRVESMNFLI